MSCPWGNNSNNLHVQEISYEINFLPYYMNQYWISYTAAQIKQVGWVLAQPSPIKLYVGKHKPKPNPNGTWNLTKLNLIWILKSLLYLNSGWLRLGQVPKSLGLDCFSKDIKFRKCICFVNYLKYILIYYYYTIQIYTHAWIDKLCKSNMVTRNPDPNPTCRIPLDKCAENIIYSLISQ